MNSKSYFTQYQSPNIIIVPTVDCQPAKRQKMENNIVVPIVDDATLNKHEVKQKSDQSNTVPAPKNESEKLNLQSPTTSKKASWATNYLQSIGLVPKASIWHQKIPRKIASQSSNICIKTTDNSKLDTNNAAIDKSSNFKQSKPANNIIKINDKPNLDIKKISPEETLKIIKKDGDYLKDNKRLKNEKIRSVVNKTANDLKTEQKTVTPLNYKKSHCTNDTRINDNKTISNYLKQPTNCHDNNNPHVKHNDLLKQTEKAIAKASKKNKNSKVLAEKLKQLKHSKKHLSDKKSSLKTKESLKDKSSQLNSKRRLSMPSTSDSRGDVKKTLKKHQNTVGEITAVKKILKVTKKYGVDHLNRLNVTKNNISTDTKQHISKTCKKDEMHKSIKERSSRKENNEKTSNAHRKQRKLDISLPIKKQAHKTKNYRKIKLVINVICNEPPSRLCNTNKNSDSRKECTASNIELDFLNDFNIDEIIECLDKCDKNTNIEHNENLLKINNSHDKNSQSIPLINANTQADATDLIKILKGEEEDDFISQSIENTNGSLFGYNFQNIQNTDPCNGDMPEKGLGVPIKIKEEMLNMFSESEKNNVLSEKTNVRALKHPENIAYRTKYEAVNKKDYVTHLGQDNYPDVRNIPLPVHTSESGLNYNSSYKNDNTPSNLVTATEDKSANNSISSEIVRKPVPPENIIIKAKEKLPNNNNKCAYKTQKVCEDAKNCKISDSDQTKEIKRDGDENTEPITQSNELNIEKDAELCLNLKATTKLSHETDSIILNEKDEMSSKPKNNESTILISEQHKLNNVNTENEVLTSNTLQNAYVKAKLKSQSHVKEKSNLENDTRNDGNSTEDSYDRKDIVTSQVMKTDDRNEKHEIEEKRVISEEQVPNCEKQVSNELSCNKNSNSENEVIIDKNFNESQKAKELHSKSSQSVTLKKDKTVDLEKALTSPTFKINEKIANQLQENIFTCLKIKYSITSLLHQGQFSTIFKCKHPTGKNYALKILTNTKQNMETKKEMWLSLQHYIPRKNVFTVYLVNAYKFEERWYILMDYYPKNLAQVLKEANKSFSVETIQDYARQIVTAVVFLRNNNMVHSDIKPRHILVNSSNNILKLCGLDRLCYVNKLTILPNMGTASYRAPEIILGYPAGFEIDVWSTGVVLFEIAANQKLFPGTYNNDILYKQICTLGYVPHDMISKSRFGPNHFMDTKFMRRMGPGGKNIYLIKKFAKNNKLSYGIFNAYYKNWSHLRSNSQQINDIEKLHTFVNLLQKMLVIHPRHRLSIEFVYGNQFIYDAYKYHEW